ncbi:MAG: STY4534 family ICE replication protein [Bradyrhizobium sp.]|uniref:STY4534 family ICE replication protein n=1 Tax=Bradyrhizobium sp. TaxID=376 RepID=UPI003D10A1F5
MSEQSQAASQSSFFNLHVEGVGYLNRVRTVKPKKGQEFLACTVSAMRGSTDAIGYTRFDCRVSGADAQKIVKRLESDVAAEKTVLIGFKIADIYPELFTFEKGDKKGQPGVSIKGRLLRVKFAKVNGEAVDLPQPARSNEPESVAA